MADIRDSHFAPSQVSSFSSGQAYQGLDLGLVLHNDHRYGFFFQVEDLPARFFRWC
ncbi:MAG: hypothetical protein ACLTQI_09265 [Slackia sp.]